MRRHRAAFVVAALAAATASDLSAQTRGTLDVGASWVDYEGFLGSAATFVKPTLRYEAPTYSVGASGTLLVFESGNTVVQGLAAGAWRAELVPGVRGELSAAAGVNAYSESPAYGHGLMAGRLYAGNVTSGAWLGGTAGRASTGTETSNPAALEVGAWTAVGPVAGRAVATRTWVEGTAYLDLVGFARWNDPGLQVEGSLGTRTWSGGGGSGAYGELQITVSIGARMAAVVAGGRYPTDPVRGVLAANYVSAALRVVALRGRRPSPPLRAPAVRPARGAASLRVMPLSGDLRRIRVTTPVATRVEMTGDLTDWVPLPLTQTGAAQWEVALPIAPGVYRINIRLDGGPWIVPLGLRAEEDDFGRRIALLVVP
jgi:hypothetical protein